MGNFREMIKVPSGALGWVYLFTENKIEVVPKHWHPSLEMTMVIAGEVDYEVNGARFVVHQGDLVLINGGDLHSCQVRRGKQGFEALGAIFPAEFFEPFSNNRSRIYFKLDAARPQHRQLAAVFRKLYHVFSRRGEDPFAMLRINALLCETAYLLFTGFLMDEFAPLAVESKKYRARCQEIIEYVEDHYREALSMRSLAARFCISREHLARVFRDYMGTTFKTHLTRVRMYMAYELLVNTDLTLIQISLDSGFSDSRAFISSFKRLYGVTPSRYRKIYRQSAADMGKRMFIFDGEPALEQWSAGEGAG